MGHKTPSLFIY